jgi:hypothetical protein
MIVDRGYDDNGKELYGVGAGRLLVIRSIGGAARPIEPRVEHAAFVIGYARTATPSDDIVKHEFERDCVA